MHGVLGRVEPEPEMERMHGCSCRIRGCIRKRRLVMDIGRGSAPGSDDECLDAEATDEDPMAIALVVGFGNESSPVTTGGARAKSAPFAEQPASRATTGQRFRTDDGDPRKPTSFGVLVSPSMRRPHGVAQGAEAHCRKTATNQPVSFRRCLTLTERARHQARHPDSGRTLSTPTPRETALRASLLTTLGGCGSEEGHLRRQSAVMRLRA